MLSPTLRDEFPILKRLVNDESLVYLDNAATTQKPNVVLHEIERFYQTSNANIHRGVHTLAQEATQEYEKSREIVRRFIHARSTKEILFTRGTTTGLNWVARGFAPTVLTPGDEIWITPMEHHSNLVPWQEIAKQCDCQLVYMPMLEDGQLDMSAIKNMLHSRVKIMSVCHISNVLGVINDVSTLAKWQHQNGNILVVDGAQAAPHMPIDVTELDCDFYAFSGHKMLAPTGIGVLYGKEFFLHQMNPIEFGGEMIEFVHDFSSTWNELPWKFEAGTPNIMGAIALGKAIEFLEDLSMEKVYAHEQELMEYVLPQLANIPDIEIYGPLDPKKHASVLAFNLKGVHPHDVATAMDMEGVAVRAGHHCAQPLLRKINAQATVRASFYLYNTKEEADKFIATVRKVKEFFEDGFI